MTETVRCPSCRGAKKVPKLGGMIGECNTCLGKGTIFAVDKPVKVEPMPDEIISKDLLNAVEGSVVASTLGLQTVMSPVEMGSSDKVVIDSVKVNGKKAIFKRKTG